MIKAEKGNERKIWLDYLRVAATFAVIVIHVSAQNRDSIGIETFEWNVFNFYDSLVRWAVPVFVMISGALFLEREQSIELIYKKYIFRIVISFAFWSVIYASWHAIIFSYGLKTIMVQILVGSYHLWFLPMIIGLYIIIPFLRKIIESMFLMRYFLILSLIFSFIIPCFSLWSSIMYVKIGDLMNNMVNNMNFYFTLGYVFYFVTGFYLNKIDINKKEKIIIYILGVCGFLMTFLFTAGISFYRQEKQTAFYDFLTVNVMFESIAVFVFAKSRFLRGGKIESIIIKLSQYSFGTYLVHVLVIEIFKMMFHINSLSFNPIISVPVISIWIFIVSYVISWGIHRIPFLSRYIV